MGKNFCNTKFRSLLLTGSITIVIQYLLIISDTIVIGNILGEQALAAVNVVKAFSGENMFLNHYTAKGGPGVLALAASFPGEIRAIRITPGQDIILQKSAFLASEPGVELSIHFSKKLGSGFFGGEGFIMQRLSGEGMAFAEIDGGLMEYELKPGEQIVVQTGNVAGFTPTVQMDIQAISGAKNVLFGGEGLFNTVLTGPGRVWLQTMPISSVANAIRPYIPMGNS